MEKQLPVMEQTLQLSETMGEGLRHVQQLLHEGKFESALPLLEDVFHAYTNIENALQSLLDRLKDPAPIQDQAEKMRGSLKVVVAALEKNEYERVKEVLQFTLLPQWKKWDGVLNDTFQGYLVS
ncbi:hypothetical protein D7Z54_28535 [Salibacterium salarium]|uniref:DUF8042 domain-containing protein n=1 Tax=Salibacterium salarium TaxID=284579 RepID=A0A428MV14_9BACI|nr:hypothetical protein [Salibacterium salarium]RSL29968.1 hypothetical protein D7Z54_28535 [Salibacterium salarium]